MKALIISDIHIENWKQYAHHPGYRLSAISVLFRDIIKNLKGKKCPILFCGDLFHNPNKLDNEVISFAMHWMKEMKDIPFVAISGNHDQCKRNTFDKRSPSHLEYLDMALDNFKLIDEDDAIYEDDNLLVCGIPYMINNDGLDKLKSDYEKIKDERFKVLMIHTSLRGAKDPSGYEETEIVGIPNNIKKYFKKWNLVISGHIHKPKKLAKNVYMVGAPYQQRTSDEGCDMGYWILDDNFKMKFNKVDYMPKFITVPEGFNPHEGDINFYIEEKKIEVQESKGLTFSNKLKPKQLGKRYLKERGIKSRSKKEILLKYL